MESPHLDGYEDFLEQEKLKEMKIPDDIPKRKPKEQYMALVQTNDLLTYFPQLSGIWKEDKREFKKLLKSNPLRRNESGTKGI